MRSKAWSLGLLAFCEVAALALWFSASAVLPSLQAEYDIGPTLAALYTSSVQAGFVAGTLASAVLGLADRLDMRRFFMASTLLATAANAAILLVEPTSPLVLLCRFVTGAAMAGIYPVGMKLATTWARGDMGLLVGLLVAAITLGTGSPHLFNAFGGLDWQFTILATSAVALAAALAINFVAVGPKHGPSPPFDPRVALEAYTVPSMRLANLGYLGHMWELFAMWAWLAVFLQASFSSSLEAEAAALWSRLAAFTAIGVGGAVGAALGGVLADRFGRTTLTMGAMTASGLTAIAIGFLYGAEPWLVFLVALFWGAVVIADSAQFSASVAELSEPDKVGTMLTMQTSVGFMLTLATVHLIPGMVEIVGWRFAFASLAIGPFLGVWAMARLRAHPESVKLAGGRR
ncbi:MAG: MFS transporter [Alphaproteobacteria bacterium]|nr:MFS transporter [Alphaproteobacteria bacterium]